MNQLSLLLYLGNVLGNLGPLCVVMGALILAGACVLWLVYAEAMDSRYRESKPSKAWPIFLTVLAPCFFFVAALCPSQETVYAIAASQLGEQVLKTPIAGKAEKALEAWLDKQIATESK